MEWLNNLPEEPGIYKFFNKKNELIYVGKAKNIKRRVTSYFSKQKGINLKTKKLVSEINNIEYSLTDTEYDALLLENNLIKENHPKYNILLKDDKTFPYICVIKERFPRIIIIRKYKKNLGEYFGPFTSVMAMKNVLQLISKLYTIRTCTYNLSEENINNKKYKVCLEYHIGNCLGPCEGLQKEAEYDKEIALAKNILKGNITIAKQYFNSAMIDSSNIMDYEKAQHYKEKYELLDKFHSKAIVVNPKLSNIDGITIVSEENTAWVNFFQLSNGAIIITRNVEIQKKMEESDEEILSSVYDYFRILTLSTNKEIITNINFKQVPPGTVLIVPIKGDKKKLIDLSLKNALEYKKAKILKEEPRKNRILLQLQNDLRLKEYPDHIECFDNSNLQGTHPVASMVCFKNGKPSKKDYRKYNIKTVEGPDDFASMKEIVYRRYKRVLEESGNLPKLLVVDGGKGQLSSAVEALKSLSLYGKIPIIGIAKRLEEIYYPEDSYPLHINKKSGSLKLIQQLRDEAHRFAITFHRQIRSKSTLNSQLTEIKGIGEKTNQLLLKKFKSIKKLKEANFEEIAKITGPKKAEEIIKELNKKG